MNERSWIPCFDGGNGTPAHEIEPLEARRLMAAELFVDAIPGAVSSAPGPPVVLDGVHYFTANNSFLGRELWRSDGTAAGTWMVKLIGREYYGSRAANDLTIVGDKIFFAGYDAETGHEAWVSDGTAVGTYRIDDLDPGNNDRRGFVGDAAAINGRFVYHGSTATDHGGVFATEGTPSNTVTLLTGVEPYYFVPHEGSLFFTAWDYGTREYQLWKTDGTQAGTSRVHTFGPTSVFTGYIPMTTPIGDHLYFAGYHPDTGYELWRSDGTPAGTRLFFDATPGPASVTPHGIVGIDEDRIFYRTVRNAGGTTYALHVTDGTAAGTRELTRQAGPLDQLTVVGDTLFFRHTYYCCIPIELWKSDGTPEGTLRLRQAATDNLTAFDGKLYFTASDSPHGNELWQSDGTLAGTLIAADVAPGPADAFSDRVPTHFTVVGERVMFAANHPDHGIELWRYTPEPVFLNPAGLLVIDSRASSPVQLHQDAQNTIAVIDGETHTFPTDSISSLVLTRGAFASLTGDAPFRLRGLSISPDATLDLGHADLILSAPPEARDLLLTQLTSHLRTARNSTSGRWKGPGITSTEAQSNALTGLATFSEQPSNENAIHIKHTYNGDANGDGRINADDYFRIDQGFLAQPANPTYARGDFNYDGKVNADDYFLIDQAFLGHGAPLTGSGDSSPLASTPVSSLTSPRHDTSALSPRSLSDRARRKRRR